MATTAADSASHFSIDSDAIRDHPSPSLHLHSSHFDIADKKPVWNKPSNLSSSAEAGPVMGPADSWPALSLSTRPSSSNKSPFFDSSKPLSDGSSLSSTPPPLADGTPLDPTSNANANANAASTAAPTSSENHTTNGQRRPFRRTNNTSSSTSSNISNVAPLNTRDHNHSQRGGLYGSGNFRNAHRNRNTSSYPRGDGPHNPNRRNFDFGNQIGFSHRNYSGTGRDLHLQPLRAFGMMGPQMPMGPPSFPASSAQYMAASHIGSYGGPMFYTDYAPHVFMPAPAPAPPPPPEPLPLAGHLPPRPMYLPSYDTMLYNRILTQVEYYFSADNMSKDKYLREQMNDEGWVPVRVLAEFRRLAELTNNVQTILEALRSSKVVEIKGETLRRRGDWNKYLIPRMVSNSSPAVAASNNASSLGSQLESMTLSEKSREGE